MKKPNQKSFPTIIISIWVGIFLFSGGMSCSKDVGKKQLPNVIYIFPDQFRKQALGIWSKPAYTNAIRTQGDPVITPNLDKFAASSVVFTQAISNFPLCSPHRGMLLSGQYPHRNGLVLNCNANRPISSLRQDVLCLSDILHEAGYSQGYFGKWHADYPTPNDPENPGHYVEERRPAWDAYTPPEGRHGFDYWYSYGTSHEHKNPHYWDRHGKKHTPKAWSPIHEAREIASYIKNEKGQRDANKPFMIMAAMNPPHSPYQSLEDCMEEDFRLYQDRPLNELLIRPNADVNIPKAKSAPYYFASVTGVDRAFGMIMDALDEMGLTENTIVVFSSDHGETMCSQGITDPKNTPYTESLDIPFMIRYPQHLKPAIEDMILSTPDIMPTLLGLIGLEDNIPAAVQGVDYAALLEGKAPAPKRPTSGLYIKNIDGTTDANGLVTGYHPVQRGIKTDRYTMSLEIDREGSLVNTYLFDNVKDPYQLNNIPLEAAPDVAADLCQELGDGLSKIEDPWYEKKYLAELIHYTRMPHVKRQTPDHDNKESGIIFRDNFDQDLDQWIVEQQAGGTVKIANGALEIDDAKGCTVWFRHKLSAPLMIEYDATVIDAGGENDRVSDLNCFWMANDPKHPEDFFATSQQRNGKFRNYHTLTLYYVGYGGHNNSKTRFRRYDGNFERPLLPEHDLDASQFMITPNKKMKLQLIANGHKVAYLRDGETIFEIEDQQPYSNGYFGFRTVNNHMKIENFKVYKLEE